MNKNINPNPQLVNFMLRAQQIAIKADRSDSGYAMVVVSVISIILFSLLTAYITMANLSKASTNAFIDGNNTFFAAEAGLNRRAQQIREKFVEYSVPTGLSPGQATIASIVSSANMSNCFSLAAPTTITTNDFECRNFPFRYNNNIATSVNGTNNTVIESVDNNINSVNYVSYTFAADTTNYAPGSNPRAPQPITIATGQPFSGLNALEYKYTVYSTASTLTNSEVTPPAGGNARTILEMNFRSRVVPLFQFAAFYDGDLEMHSGTNMDIGGKVHTNSNLYFQPAGANPTTLRDSVTAAGSIFRRLDAVFGGATTGDVRLQIGTGGTATFLSFPTSASAYTTTSPIDLTQSIIGSLSASNSGIFKNTVRDSTAGIVPLTVPDAGFLRKRNYFKSSAGNTSQAVGEYWSKADMRLEMVPDRDAVAADGITNLTDTQINTAIANSTLWQRNQSIIPFNFTSIQTGGTGACSTTAPALNTDPDANYIDPDRQNAANLKCNIFTKGQLQSLRQPVLVLTDINNPTAIAQERTTLGAPGTFTVGTTNLASTTGRETQILRALQVALASTSRPVPLDSLAQPLNNGTAYAAGTPAADFRAEFNRLIGTIPGLSSGNFDTWSPNQIAALRNAWFLPAPIQRLTSNIDTATRLPTGSGTTSRAASNYRSSGFYDSRERRWITMLQTNIRSLTVWNRDGLYVEAENQTMTLPYTASNTNRDAAFNSGNGANFTNNLAFVRETNIANFATAPAAGSLQSLGLGSNDRTEGGIVFHTTINDDLNGNGTSDVTATTPIFKLNSNGTATAVIQDRLRQYYGGGDYRSPFGFAFNGGDFLPAPMNIATDLAIYIQGNFNNNNAAQTNVTGGGIIAPNPNRLPAAIMGDTINILSNQCITDSSTPSATNHLGVLAGQIRCGLPREANGSINVTQGGNTATFYGVTGSNAVNAAFLSRTDRSQGNCNRATGTWVCGAPRRASGGVNNYIRMLEDWQNVLGDATGARYFNYSGSFISLGAPLEYSGTWVNNGASKGNGSRNINGTPDYYNIPSRNYNYDTNFNTFNLLPPLTPRAVYLRQDVFKKNY